MHSRDAKPRYWWASLLFRAWHSLGISRAAHLLVRLSWAMLFAMGSLYALYTMIGEHYYARGMTNSNVQLSVEYLRAAAQYSPFDPQNRAASARYISIAALNTSNKQWLEAARVECIIALQVDYSSADILLKLMAIDLQLNNVAEAQFFYEQFKRVDASSPVIKLVDEHNRQQAGAAVASPH
jgi:hypothetical protein